MIKMYEAHLAQAEKESEMADGYPDSDEKLFKKLQGFDLFKVDGGYAWMKIPDGWTRAQFQYRRKKLRKLIDYWNEVREEIRNK